MHDSASSTVLIERPRLADHAGAERCPWILRSAWRNQFIGRPASGRRNRGGFRCRRGSGCGPWRCRERSWRDTPRSRGRYRLPEVAEALHPAHVFQSARSSEAFVEHHEIERLVFGRASSHDGLEDLLARIEVEVSARLFRWTVESSSGSRKMPPRTPRSASWLCGGSMYRSRNRTWRSARAGVIETQGKERPDRLAVVYQFGGAGILACLGNQAGRNACPTRNQTDTRPA